MQTAKELAYHQQSKHSLLSLVLAMQSRSALPPLQENSEANIEAALNSFASYVASYDRYN